MPPRAKRAAEAKNKVLADALALLAKHNKDTTEMKPYVEVDFRNTEAVAVFVHEPHIFEARVCKNCGKSFAHSQKIPAGTRVSFCSDFCRREDWRKNMRIPYEAVSIKDPWEGDPPLIVNPVQYENLRRIADWFSRNREALRIAADREKAQAQSQAEEDQWDSVLQESESPTPIPETPDENSQPFDIFAEKPTDQGEPHTTHDSWIFG